MTSLNSLTFLPPPVPKIRQLKTPRLADSQIKIKTADYQEICRRFDEEGISDGQGLRIFSKLILHLIWVQETAMPTENLPLITKRKFVLRGNGTANIVIRSTANRTT